MFLKAQMMQFSAVKSLLRSQTEAINKNTTMIQALAPCTLLLSGFLQRRWE
jgi:hypothetical protein